MLPVCDFCRFNQKNDWLVLFENCPLPTKRTRSIVSRSDFVTTKVKIRNGKPLQKELHFPTKRIKPIVTRWQEPFCTVQHKFLTVGNIAYMSTFPDSRPFADICASLLGFCARFAVKTVRCFILLSLSIGVECEHQDSTRHLAGNLFNKRTPNFNLHQNYHLMMQKNVSNRVASNCGDE